ncbi:IS407A, transposase OrfA [Burkholderia pseudomallei]|nr:IS407A, transposase OrfA [Burkholderia pseudomallei]
MKKRFTEQQIIGFLKEAEAGMPVKELCRKHGFSDASPGRRAARRTAERRPEDGRRPPAPRKRAATCADHGFVVETL